MQESETRNIKARGQPRAQKQKGVLEQSISYTGTETESGGERKRGKDTERRGRVPRGTSEKERETRSREETSEGAAFKRYRTSWHEEEEEVEEEKEEEIEGRRRRKRKK